MMPIHADLTTVSYDDPISETYFLYGRELLITNEAVPKDRDTNVRADTINLAGQITTLGRDITLFARLVTVSPGTSIDTRGDPAFPDHTGVPPRNGQAAGEDGADGQDGGDGPSGGKVTIIAESIKGNLSIDSSGQKGGAAQPGGTGAEGTPGAANSKLGSTGGQGGPGGKPGRAGRPGRGGNSGAVTITTVIPIADGQITITAEPGDPGDPAIHGKPGEGGRGGLGASGIERRRECM